MPICVPIKGVKDTAKFSRLVEEASGPVTVTKNGYDAFAVMRSDDYDRMLSDRDDAARQKLLERMVLAEREISEGKFADYDEATRELKAKYGL